MFWGAIAILKRLESFMGQATQLDFDHSSKQFVYRKFDLKFVSHPAHEPANSNATDASYFGKSIRSGLRHTRYAVLEKA
jgi:hypothetical protein